MENKKEMVCACDNCNIPAWHGRHLMLRWFLGVVILMMVFGLGVKIGEFKEIVDRASFGSNYHQDYWRSIYQMPMYNQNLIDNQSGEQVKPTGSANSSKSTK